MRRAQTAPAKEFDQFSDGLLVLLQTRFLRLLFFGILCYSAPGLIVERVSIPLDLLRVIVRVERGLHDFKVLHELQRDSLRALVQAACTPVANGQEYSEDGLDAMAENLDLACVYGQGDA